MLELLVVISIIGILAALMVPALARAKHLGAATGKWQEYPPRQRRHHLSALRSEGSSPAALK